MLMYLLSCHPLTIIHGCKDSFNVKSDTGGVPGTVLNVVSLVQQQHLTFPFLASSQLSLYTRSSRISSLQC